VHQRLVEAELRDQRQHEQALARLVRQVVEVANKDLE
jgi:hypothetical protein